MMVLMINTINQSLFLVLNSALYIPIEFIWLNISAFGDPEVIAILLLPIIARRPDIIWAAFIANSITIFSVELAKKYFALPRPPVILDYDRFHQIGNLIGVDSFPSDHTAVVFSITAVVILLVKQQWIKITIVLCACLIALSQIAIGSSWPIDIFAGVIAGWLPATVGVNFAKKKYLQSILSKKILAMLLISIAIYMTLKIYSSEMETVILKILILVVSFIVSIKYIRDIFTAKLTVKRKNSKIKK